ncbi:hypothetical protein FNF31_07361 [Cafeteria roenbergensis]|uniref:Uncharacterized protein n=1 Tax=Cafeteria roenbergensis TaxID=33653 RepID=A0A5A8C6I0_CAFRO|nr:hypothetical protein FNF31_07361 [Cafeteria roenbergensis]
MAALVAVATGVGAPSVPDSLITALLTTTPLADPKCVLRTVVEAATRAEAPPSPSPMSGFRTAVEDELHAVAAAWVAAGAPHPIRRVLDLFVAALATLAAQRTKTKHELAEDFQEHPWSVTVEALEYLWASDAEAALRAAVTAVVTSDFEWRLAGVPVGPAAFAVVLAATATALVDSADGEVTELRRLLDDALPGAEFLPRRSSTPADVSDDLETGASEPSAAPAAPAAPEAFPVRPLPGPSDLLIKHLYPASDVPDWAADAHAVADASGSVLSCLSNAAVACINHLPPVYIRACWSVLMTAYALAGHDGPLGIPVVAAVADVFGKDSLFSVATTRLNAFGTEISGASISPDARDKLSRLFDSSDWTALGDTAVAAQEFSETGETLAPPPLPPSLRMAARHLLLMDDPMMLVDIIGLPDHGSHLLAQRLACRAICAPSLRPPTPEDIAATPAAARPDAALWLLTPFASRELALARSASQHVDVHDALYGLTCLAKSASASLPPTAQPPNVVDTLLAAGHALRDHRTTLEQSLPDGPGAVLPPIAERMLARAELSCLFSALQHVQIATAHWVLPAVHAGIPLLPALLATAAMSIAAFAGVGPDAALAAWLASRGIHVTAGFAPVYDDSTRASVAFKCAEADDEPAHSPPRGPARPALHPADTLAGRFASQFGRGPSALASALMTTAQLPPFRWTHVLGQPLEVGPWAALSHRWPAINNGLRQLLPEALAGPDLRTTIASMVSATNFRPFPQTPGSKARRRGKPRT